MTPRVQGETLVYRRGEQEQEVQVGTAAWYAWLETASTFSFAGAAGTFTARREQSGHKRGGWYWKAYRRQQGKLTSRYLGKSETLTLERLNAIAMALAAATAPTEVVVSAPAPAWMSPVFSSQRSPETTPISYDRSLLITKSFIPPPISTLVARPRLIARLAAGVRHPLTLVTAPAGWGKTTLLSAWSADPTRGDSPVAWISLEEPMNDPVCFWTYLVAALNTVYVGVGDRALTLLCSPQTPPIETVLTMLVNDLAILPLETVLILDDYHVIEAPAIHHGLSFLLDHLPPRLHLVIASRSDPPLSLPRLLVHGRLTELRASELRFTSEEAAAFLTQVMGLSLTVEQIEALETHTEGWIAGLHLAALAMRDRTDRESFIATFTGNNRYVMDYLVEEVLQQQPERIQNFLLRTALLDRLNGPLCDALLGTDDSQETLEQLERANLFLVPLDEERRWYRYHHLFADVLRSRIQQSQPAMIQEIHRSASAWYEQNGMLVDAVQHALLASDMERARRVIERIGLPLIVWGRIQTILDWFRVLPDEVVRPSARLCLLQATMLSLTKQVVAAEARLQDAEAHVQEETAADQAPVILGWATVIRATIVRYSGDFARSMALARQALDLLPEAEQLLRASALIDLTAAYLVSGNVAAESEHAITGALATIYASGNTSAVLRGLVLLAHLHVLQGKLHQAAVILEQTGQLVPGHEDLRGLIDSSFYYFCLGDLLREWNQLDEAERHLMQGIKLLQGPLTLDADILTFGAIALARLYQARGNYKSALMTLDELAEQARICHFVPHLHARGAAVRVEIELAAGNVASPALWAGASGLSPTDAVNYLQEREYLTLARVRIAQGRGNSIPPLLSEVLGLLERLLEDAEAKARKGSVLEILMLRALALDAQGDRTGALAALERALMLAEPEGYIRLFADEGLPMVALLRQAYGIAPDYVATLLQACGEPSERSSLLHAPRPSPLVEPLTEREREVLRLLAAGASNREIAHRLVVSVGTAKKHVSNICGKLGAASRTQALARAREFHIL